MYTFLLIHKSIFFFCLLCCVDILYCNFTNVSILHRSKAPAPMLVTCAGMVNSVSPKQSWKAPSAMAVTELHSVMVARLK